MTKIITEFLILNSSLRLRVGNIRLIPAIFVIAGIDDQDIPFLYIHFVSDHFRGVKTVIRNLVRDIDHYPFPGQIGQRNISNRPGSRMKCAGTDQMRAGIVAPLDLLPVCSLASTE